MVYRIGYSAGRSVIFVSLVCGVIASAVEATPPVPPWRSIERIAERGEIDIGRAQYHQNIDALLQKLQASPLGRSNHVLMQRALLVGSLMTYLLSWAQVEGRRLLRG